MTLCICQNPQKFTIQRVTLNACKYLKYHLGSEWIPRQNAKCSQNNLTVLPSAWANLIEGDRGKGADLSNFENECRIQD